MHKIGQLSSYPVKKISFFENFSYYFFDFTMQQVFLVLLLVIYFIGPGRHTLLNFV